MRLRHNLAAGIVLALFAVCGADAAEGDTVSVLRQMRQTVKGDVLDALAGWAHVVSSPVRWDGGYWLTAGGVVVGVSASSLLDSDVRRMMQRNRSGLNDDFSNVAVNYGDGLEMLALSAGGYIAGLTLREKWLRETSLLAGTAIVTAGTLSTLSKIIAGRARPYMNKGPGVFKPFTISAEDYASFPSGHTVVAFAFSGVLSERIGNLWATIGLYGMAAGTAYARSYTDHHWFSDVVAGAAISVPVSRSLVRYYEDDQEEEKGLCVVPGINGVTLLWKF